MHLFHEADAAVKRYRERQDLELGAPSQAYEAFRNPGPDNPVGADHFLAHLSLDLPEVVHVIEQCYPQARVSPELRQAAAARIRFWGWATLTGHDNLHSAYQALRVNLGAVKQLGFRDGLPCYETLRHFVYDLWTPDRAGRVEAAILRDMKRLQPGLGESQVEDCTPHEALRRDDSAPYNPHYKVKMQRLELRWDADCAALLAHQFFYGNANENRWANHLTKRLARQGVLPSTLTTDNGYTGFLNHALHWRHGIQLIHKTQDGWVIDVEAARLEVEKRFQNQWANPHWPAQAAWNNKLGFLYDHGSQQDREAVGRWLRDDMLSNATPAGEDRRKQLRAQNEGLNAEIKRLPIRPQRQGVLWLLRRAMACTLTLFLVQWNRLLHGIQTNLCRTAYIR